MVETVRASIQKLTAVIDLLRSNKGWNRQDERWCKAAKVSMPTLKRFWRRQPIRQEFFSDICQAVGLENWEEIIDNSPIQQKAQISPSLDYDDGWVGRAELISQLSSKLRGGCRVLILTGITGIGKTVLAERLAVQLQSDFSESFRVNFDHEEQADFASVAAQLLTGWGETLTPENRQEPQRLLNWVVSCLRQNSYLVLIDSVELILKGNAETGWSDFQDEWWEKFFQSLLSANSCKSRVILTSQDLPGQLEAIGLGYPKFWYCQSLSGFNQSEQLELFEKMGLEISGESSARTYLERMGAAYEGHPLALRAIAGEIINHPFNGNVGAYWTQYGHEVEEVEQIQQQADIESADDRLRLDRYTRSLQRAVKQRIEKTFERLAKDVFNAYMLLCFGSVYRRPVPEKFWLKPLEGLGFDRDKQLAALDALRDRYLIEEEIVNDNLLLRQHNLIRSTALFHLKNWNNSSR